MFMFRLQRLAVLASKRPCQRIVTQRTGMAAFSDSITYSGGQATEGQGGYYGSGGARVLPQEGVSGDASRQNMLALAADVQKITAVMKELDSLEGLLERETDATTGRSIELNAGIKKLMTHPEVLESLNRLEIQGEPVWGLSTQERELIITAREKVNEC